MKIVASLLLALAASASAFTAAPVVQTSTTALYAEEEETSTSQGAAAISALTADVKTVMTTEDINKVLPHRYPFAFVDKVVEYEPGKRAVGIKQVTKVRRIYV